MGTGKIVVDFLPGESCDLERVVQGSAVRSVHTELGTHTIINTVTLFGILSTDALEIIVGRMSIQLEATMSYE